MMERAEILAAMADLKLFGMRAAYDELMATAVRRQHEPQRVVSDLLAAEINEKKARSVKYQITVAKLPVAREIEELTFDGTPINETLVRDLARGGVPEPAAQPRAGRRDRHGQDSHLRCHRTGRQPTLPREHRQPHPG